VAWIVHRIRILRILQRWKVIRGKTKLNRKFIPDLQHTLMPRATAISRRLVHTTAAWWAGAFQSQIFFEQLHGVLRDLDLGLPREWQPIRRQQWGYLGLGQGKKTRVRDFNN
jgi:hypothetical protein